MHHFERSPWPAPCVLSSDFRLPQSARSGLDLTTPKARSLAGIVDLERDGNPGASLSAESGRSFDHACPNRRRYDDGIRSRHWEGRLKAARGISDTGSPVFAGVSTVSLET